jgi:hypothetical protein
MTGVDSPAAPGRPGTRLGRYEIDSALSGGGMGDVYRAHDVDTGATVVLKRVDAGGHANRFSLSACQTEAACTIHASPGTLRGRSATCR